MRGSSAGRATALRLAAVAELPGSQPRRSPGVGHSGITVDVGAPELPKNASRSAESGHEPGIRKPRHTLDDFAGEVHSLTAGFGITRRTSASQLEVSPATCGL